jgi:hypothetical protein
MSASLQEFGTVNPGLADTNAYPRAGDIPALSRQDALDKLRIGLADCAGQW